MNLHSQKIPDRALLVISLLVLAVPTTIFAVLNYENQQPQWTFTTDGSATSVAISPDSTHIAMGISTFAVRSGQVILLNRSGKVLWTHNTDSEINSVDFSPEGSHILAAGYEINATTPSFAQHFGRIYYLDQNGGELWNRTLPVVIGAPDGPRFPSLSAKISSDGTRIFVNEGPGLTIFDTNGKLIWSYSSNDFPNSTNYIFGGSLASANFSFVVMIDDKIHAFNIQGNSVWNSTVPSDYITAAIISEDGKYMALAGESQDPHGAGYINSTLFLFDKSGQLAWTRSLPGGSQSLEFSADDTFIVVQSQGTAAFNLQNQPLWNYTGGPATTMDLSSDGSYVLASMGVQSDPPIRVLNNRGAFIWGTTGTGEVHQLRISPDNSYAAIASWIYRSNIPLSAVLVSLPGPKTLASERASTYSFLHLGQNTTDPPLILVIPAAFAAIPFGYFVARSWRRSRSASQRNDGASGVTNLA